MRDVGAGRCGRRANLVRLALASHGAALAAALCLAKAGVAGEPSIKPPASPLPRGEIEIGKERFWLPGHGSARLVLRLRAPEERLDPARLDVKVRAAAEAIGPVPWVRLADATHSVRLDLHYIDPRIDRPHGEHIPYVAVLLAWTQEASGAADRTVLLPMMDPFFAYANLLRLPGPGPYRFDLTLRPIPLPGMPEPGEFRRTYRVTLP